MTVSVIIIGINIGRILPQYLDFSDPNFYKLNKEKFIVFSFSIIYFAILVSVIKSPAKSPSLLDSSYVTLEVNLENVNFFCSAYLFAILKYF